MANQSVEAYKRKLARCVEAAYQAALPIIHSEARAIGSQMKAAVPRRSGALAESIRLEADQSKPIVRILAGSGSTLDPASTYNYARAQEFGTQNHPANPFFYPVFRLMAKPARRRINKAVKDAIEAEFKK